MRNLSFIADPIICDKIAIQKQQEDGNEKKQFHKRAITNKSH